MSCCCTERSVVNTEKAPKAIGPYSVAVKAGHVVYTAGQAGLDPQSGNLVTGGIEAETRQVFTNLKNVLEAAGTSLDNVVKTSVFLQDMADFTRMNVVYAEFFTGNYPARTTVQAAALPKGALVEIDCIALMPAEDCDCEDCNCNKD